MERRGVPVASRAELTVATVAAAGLVLVVALAHLDGGDRGIGGVLRFREDGRGVTAFGTVILALFIATTALGTGACVASGATRVATAAALLAKFTLVAAVVFMFAFPDLSQFEAKSLTWRAILYPTLSFSVAALWAWRGRRVPFPWLFDLTVGYVLLFDIVSNDLHWYGTWLHWDDFVHFFNSIPFFVVVAAPLLVAERRGAFRLGFWGVLAFALTIYVSLHTLWEIEEFSADRFLGTNLQPGGMEEATRNNLAGIAGAALGIALLAWWRGRGALDARLVAPLADLWAALRGFAPGNTAPRGPTGDRRAR